MSSFQRVHNFSAGPACLPPSVLEEAQAEMMSYEGSGMSFMEMSHRDVDGPVQKTITEAESLVKELLSVPDNYDIIFMHGGAHGQFSAVPMNLAFDSGKADYLDGGAWSKKAMNEAAKYADVQTCASYTNSLPPVSEWKIRPDAAYVHICLNETMTGVEFLEDPVLPEGSPILVADGTSTLFSRTVDISRYGLIYASAGKNFGPAGLCLVILRHDLLARTSHPHLPSVLDYHQSVHSVPISSVYNTPPCFQLYMSTKVWRLTKKLGGLPFMEAQATRRSSRIYQIFDESDGFYVNNVDPACRSRMNMCFRIRDAAEGNKDAIALEKLFVAKSEEAGLFQLFGHPVYGGLRITVYNGQEEAAVETVAAYLVEFQKKYGGRE